MSVIHIGYDNFSKLVNKDLLMFSDKKIDCVVAIMNNGLFPASIIANTLNKSLIFAYVNKGSKEVSFSVDKDYFLDKKILLVDDVINSGETLKVVKSWFQQLGRRVNSYATFVKKDVENKPNFVGREFDDIVIAPWNSRENTPQSILDKLVSNDGKSKEDCYCLGFSSLSCKDEFYSKFEVGSKILYQFVYQDDVVTDLLYDDVYLDKDNYQFILMKANFIKENGITHFVEEDWVNAILLSESCEATNIIFFDGREMHLIYGRKVQIEEILSLKF